MQPAQKLASIVADERKSHLLLVALATVNLLLLVITIFFLLRSPAKQAFPKIKPISADTPVVRFSLVSPTENSTVSGIVPLVTTLSNGPQIIKTQLAVNGQQAQSLFSQETEKLIVFWDTAKHPNGSYKITITAYDSQNGASQLFASFNVENKQEDIKKPPR